MASKAYGLAVSFGSFSSTGFFRAACAFLVNKTAVLLFTPVGEAPNLKGRNEKKCFCGGKKSVRTRT